MIDIEDIWSATDRGYEAVADMQYKIALHSRITGDVTIYNQAMVKSMEIYANIQALESLNFRVSVEQDRKIHLLFNRTKELTIKFKTWDIFQQMG